MRLIDADKLLKDIEELKLSPWFNRGKMQNDNFPFLHTLYLERKEAVEIVEKLCINDAKTITPLELLANGKKEGVENEQATD